MDEIPSFFGFIIILIILLILFGVAYGFHYAFTILDEKISVLIEGINTYGSLYDNDYFDLDGNKISLKYIKRIDGYEVNYFKNNEASDSKNIFLQEKKFMYKSYIENKFKYLVLDDEEGEEVIMIDNHNMIYFNKTPLIKKNDIIIPNELIPNEPFNSKDDDAEEL